MRTVRGMKRSGLANLLGRLAARHGSFLLITSLLLGGFEFLLCGIVSTIDLPSVLTGVMKTIPPPMRALIEQQFLGGMGNAGILAFGWTHPITLALGAAVAITLASRAVAGELENGAIELVLSQPISRSGYFFGNVGFSLAALAVMTAIGIGGSLLGQSFYGLKVFDAALLARLGLNFWLLQSAWFGIALVASVLGRESGRVAFAGFILALISYIVQVLGQLWSGGSFLLPYSLNFYFSPRSILVERRLSLSSVAILAGISVATILASSWRFRRRDIP